MSGLLAVVPVRIGSMGVRRKALQTLEGEPLVLRTLRLIRESGVAERIVVSTSSQEVASICRLRGWDVLHRPDDLSAPETPLRPVLRHVAHETGWSGIIACFQSTCPLLTPQTIRNVVARFEESDWPWAITAVPEDHIIWAGGRLLQPRVNRQMLGDSEKVYRESGAITLYRPYAFDAAANGTTILIPPEEALDIDTWAELSAARAEVHRKQILIQIAVGKEIGSGHLYRALRLAEGLGHHDVAVTTSAEAPQWAIDMLREANLIRYLRNKPDLVILDRLDTTVQMVAGWRAEGVPVVTFEDEGRGAYQANLVVNELLRPHLVPTNLYGPCYSILRSEFLAPPPYEVKPTVERVLVTFGGTDPAGLNERVARILPKHVEVRVATPDANMVMSEEMHRADLCFTSQGRTQYEAAAMGVPTITLAANERESRHAPCPGQIHFGLHAKINDNDILNTFWRIAGNPALRQEMSQNSHAAIDGRGLDRVVWHIEGLLRGLT